MKIAIALAALLAIGPPPVEAQPATSSAATRPACGRRLADVRAQWQAAAAATGPAACRTKEALWTEIRGCFAGYGEWVPDLRDVGDCYVAAEDPTGARSFYERTMRSLGQQLCTHDGWTCAQAAAVELRLIACGFEWLASTPDEAWRAFSAAILSPAAAAPAAFRLPPVVSAEDPREFAELTCRADPDWKQAYGGDRGFGVPRAILRNATSIAEAAAAGDASQRAVSVELDAEERQQAHHKPDAAERYLRIQACPFTRPHPGAGTRFFIDLNLATAAERDTAVCASPWSWIARRLP